MKIAFIGGGNMAAALIAGLAGKLTAGANIHVVDPNSASLDKLRAQFGVTTAAAADAAVSTADVIVLAVKPQIMKEVTTQLLPLLPAGGGALLLSIAAGIRAADLSRWLGGYAAIVRTMPNTPALIGQGITGMVAASGVSAAQREAADAIMQAVGGTVWLDDEALIDPVTAVSGSGPAYVFYFIESMIEGAVQAGFAEDEARRLVLATFDGAVELARQSPLPVATLRQNVMSKGGTTERAIFRFEADGVKTAIVAGMEDCRARSVALGIELSKD